jgi:signal recognition particle subunit SRP68
MQLSGSSSAPSAAGVRDIHFIHAFIVYQLLSRRTERDLLLLTALIPRSTKSGAKEQVDSRLYPAVVKLLETLLQNLTQMRSLSIVDESPDLASAVEARISFTKSRK